MPFITVIIPCYNAESHINRCLDALERQKFSDFNVIFIDDCSSDNTVGVLEAFQKKTNIDVHVMKNDINSGPAYSRNRGIASANGEYIAFCDSDDWYDDAYLLLMAQAAMANTADMVFCNSKKVLPNGKELLIKMVPGNVSSLDRGSVLLFGVDSLCSLIVKRDIILDIPQPDIRNGEDMAIIPMLILNSHRFNTVESPIYNYYCRPGSLSLKASEKVTDSLIDSFAFIHKNKKLEFDTEIEFIGLKNVVYGALLNHYKCSKDNHKANCILCDFESCYPNCYRNKYMYLLPIHKKIFVFCAKYRLYFALKLLSLVHNWLFA